MKKGLLALILVLSVFTSTTYAKDDALAAPGTVTVGERVASFLQNYFNAFSSIIVAERVEKGKKLFAPRNTAPPLRANIFYSQRDEVISVLVVGNLDSTEAVKPVLQQAKAIILSASKNVEANFGVTLTDNDLVMIYYSGAVMKPILTFKDGNYMLPADAQ